MQHFLLASPQHSLAGFVIDLNPEEGRISFYAERDQIGLNFNALLKLVADVDLYHEPILISKFMEI
jgi:hypothetical protein